ncbi:MAG TPA: hypothetical protein VFJ51_13470 [Nitrososphaeraceae archaeon]|nr:hypothetical protein [Nitrososphaeraceae archaeon]
MYCCNFFVNEFRQFTDDLYQKILHWRSRPDIFQKGIGDIEVDVRISKLWQEVEQLKKDMKQVVNELAKIDQKLTPEERYQSKKFDAVS